MPRKSLPEFQDRFRDETETAELINISLAAIRQDRWIGALGIPYHKFGRRVRYRLSEVIAWAEGRRVVPPVRRLEEAMVT
jgi:Helix-turn-helix domain